MLLEDFAHQTPTSQLLQDFTSFACEFLGIDCPSIQLHDSTDFSQNYRTFGLYNTQTGHIQVSVVGRHMMDIFRTLVHEMVHHRQILQGLHEVWTEADLESDANTVAALCMRAYGKLNPQTFTAIYEDAAVNAAGSGAIAGIGIPPHGEPGSPPRTFLRRKKFAGHDVFEVPSEYYLNSKLGKKKYAHYKEYVGDDDIGHEIRTYGNTNYGKPIILQDASTGHMLYLRYGRS